MGKGVEGQEWRGREVRESNKNQGCRNDSKVCECGLGGKRKSQKKKYLFYLQKNFAVKFVLIQLHTT